jgi:TolA-binding protein
MKALFQVLVAASTAFALTTTVAARQDVSSTDVQRLQDLVNDVGSDVATYRKTDATAARRMQAELDELQEDVIYLKVSLRKRQAVPRSDYTDVRDRLEALRSRARGDEGSRGGYATPSATPTPAPAPAPAPTPRPSDPVVSSTPPTTQESSSTRSTKTARGVVPVGTELDVRLQTALNSGTAKVEDRFEATTLVDLAMDEGVLIPSGSVVRGVVTDVKAAGRVERKGSLTLSFDQVTVNGRAYPIRGTVTQTVEAGGYRQDAGKIGTGAVIGGIIGGILGGAKGAIAGVLVGGGGVVAATEGQDVDLKPGTVLRMRFDSEVSLR